VSNATKTAVPLLLVVAVAASAFYFLNQADVPAPAPVSPVAQQPAEKPADPPPEPAAVAEAPPTRQEPIREAAKPRDSSARTDAPQGIKGRVLLPNGAPAAQVPVFLMENSMNDPINLYLKAKQGVRTPPVSSGHTADDGTFALGVGVHGKDYDLRVASDEYPELNHQKIRPHEEEWYDTGDLRLEPGNVVAGLVVDEATKAGVPEATVFLVNSNQAYSMVATPGRERGIAAVTDRTGAFRFANAPQQGLVNLAVEAAGYASAQLLNQQVKPDGPNEYTIEVARGQPIAGVVVDPDGKPVAGISITASGLSAKTPQTATAVSQPDGTFAFESLREGPYQLVTNSSQHNEAKSPPVMTGDRDVKIVLAQRAFVKLRVLAANRAPVKSFSLSLKRHFPNSPLGIGNVPEFGDRRINPADFPAEFGGEWAVVRGLPPGDFVFQLQDNQHAKSLSPPFKVAEGEPAPEVEAVLTLGAGILGLVVDDSGRPVAGATVSTDMSGAFLGDGGPFFEIFRSFIPEKHSKASVKTDAQGRFRLGKLAFADYMVRVAHPDFCEGNALDIKLDTEGSFVDVGTIQLSRGAIVEGFTTIGGEAAGQIKISITPPQPEGPPKAEPSTMAQPQKPPKPMFSASAISETDGRYRLLKRVPPGTYKIHASRQSGSNNPFETLLDMRETEQQLVVNPGQDRLAVNFNLSRR